MEKALIQTKQKGEGLLLQLQSPLIGIAALLLGSLHFPPSFVFSFYYLSYFYMRDRREYHVAMAGILLGSLINGIFTTYLYLLGMTVFYLMIHILHYFHKNIYRSMPYVLAFVSIPYGFYQYGMQLSVFVVAFVMWLLCDQNMRDPYWIQKRLVLTSHLTGVLLFSLAYACSAWLPEGNGALVSCALLLLAGCICAPISLVLLSLLYVVMMPSVSLPLFVWIAMIWISIMRDNQWVNVMGLILIALWFPVDMAQMALLGGSGLFHFLTHDKHLSFSSQQRYQTMEELEASQNTLNQQIQHFSGIFAALSQYYEQVSDVEAQMLADMANALKYSADTLKKVDTKQTQKQRIAKALEGYQYEVAKLEMDVSEDGSLAIDVALRGIKRSEIEQTLLPLMEVLTHEHLYITSLNRRFAAGTSHITFENAVPFGIDAYADSQKNKYESSGDTFSIFRYRNSVISMISDGMGSGEHAAASSRLITNLFQRMVVSGIPKADAIKCINKLIQSDSYATLDVVCFDCSTGKAYIFKSAACPTFLIRNGELYEVNGSSLPVGILSAIEPDCFVMDLKEGDEYLIISDGVFIDEIYEWLKYRDTSSVKASVEDLMAVLQQRERKDDSTVVLSKVYTKWT